LKKFFRLERNPIEALPGLLGYGPWPRLSSPGRALMGFLTLYMRILYFSHRVIFFPVIGYGVGNLK
jgi:hypothetical protein